MKSTRRHTTRRADIAYLAARFDTMRRAWGVGDACRSFFNGYDRPNTTVASVDGDIITLADGSAGHYSRMAGPR